MEGGRWSKLFITSVVGGQPATETYSFCVREKSFVYLPHDCDLLQFNGLLPWPMRHPPTKFHENRDGQTKPRITNQPEI